MPRLRAAYTLTTRLRDTPQAVLFRGHRNADLRPVILKIPHGDRPSAVQLARLRHEYAILQLFDTPAVVRALGLEMADDGAALVLEDLGDQSLDALVGPAPVELESFLRTAIAMAEGVETVHRHHIIHKDIKPHHFFRSATTGALTLIDFGVATRLSLEERRATNVRHLDGTLAYMSPEQTGRMNRVVDRRTDLYSLGVAYYQLLTGVLPFQATDPLEIVHSHIAREPVPPRAVASGTPKIISDIVLKLLSKSADDRYQDVAGLKADLVKCLESIRGSGTLAEFPLGQDDFSDELCIPQKLYGREKDARALTATFERVRTGGAELLLIAGPSGIGKSALVGELQRQTATKGHFVTGKFDQLGRHIPYAPISRACGELVRSILTESPESIEVWRQKILDAVGPNGQVIFDLVPALALVIGAQPKLQELGPAESQHRFARTFSAFLSVFAVSESPLILFVDDLQWADPASLQLIHVLLTSLARNPLLLIGAYRDNEVDTVHPLSLALTELRKVGVPVGEIKLAPLSLDDATALVADALAATRQQVAPLARLVFEKTLGNPFFSSQFLMMLYQEHLLSFDTAARRWRFDIERIEKATVTDNVVDFMVGKLRRLGPATQQMLMIAACVGHHFDRRTLSLVAQRSSSEVAAALWDALREGVVVPLDLGSEYLHEGEADKGEADQGASGRDTEEPGLNPSYRFLHDRVQQAAYAMMEERERAQMHLRIGRSIVAAGAGSVPDERLFEVVNHLDLGASLVTDAGERRELARLNLAAGRRALDAAAHASALKLLDTCLELLGEEGWKNDYATALASHLAKAQCAYVMGRRDDAFRVLDAIEQRATNVIDRAAALELRILILSSTNRLRESVECGVAAARLLGAVLPDNDDELGPAIGATFGAIAAALGDRPIESLIDLPLMTDPWSLALVRVLHRTIPAAIQYNPRLMTLLVAKAIEVALQHGNSPEMSYFYVCWGMVMAVMGDAEPAYRAGQLGLRLNERLNHVVVEAPSRFVFGALVAHWTRPLSDGMDHLQKGLKASLDAGHYFYASFCTMFHAMYGLFRGDALEEVAAQVRDITDLQRRSGAVANANVTEHLGILVATLRGGTQPSRSEPGGPDTEAALLASGNRFLISSLFLFRAIERYFASDWDAAGALLEKAWPPSPGNMVGPEIRFFRALVLAERARAAAALGEQAVSQGLVGELQGEEATLSKWAAASPKTFGHRHALVAAELASFGTDDGRTLTLYDRAVATAREARSIMHEALAAELAGRFAARRGWQSIAALYFRKAADAYARWGAKSKAKEVALEARQGDAIESGALHESTRAGEVAGRASLGSTELSSEQLDAMTLVKATQAISTEIVLPKLIATLMRIVIEQAGAECGYLLLEHDGELWVEGAAGGEAASFQRFHLDDAGGGAGGPTMLPRSIVGYVQRSREKVLLPHADRPSMFSADPYLARQRPRSLLCLPMVRQGSLVGLLYLENRLTGGAFSSDRVDLLDMLSTQAAISLENAILYDEMEERVEDRTRALEASLTTIQEKQTDLANRNRDMRLVLDHVAQGLITIDRTGSLSPERSRVVDEWLSPIAPGTSFREYFEQIDPSFSESFVVGFEMLLDDVLPEELAISQLPTALRKGDRHFKLSYEPIKTGTDLTGLLVVIDDMTEVLQRARAEAEQEEVLALCRLLTQQRSGLLGFFSEAGELTRVIRDAAETSPELRRSLHTLKGNAAMLGLSLLSSLCHEAEETLAAKTFARQHVEPVVQRFGELRVALASLAGERASEHIQVPREALKLLARQIEAGLPAREASKAVERLTLEPLGVPLARLGEYARDLSGRLDKGALVVDVDDGGLMGDPQRSTPLFATLIHLVRNAVDHGLETEPERTAERKGAPTMTLSTSEEGADLCITVADNGRGIDWDRVRAAAEARGIPSGSREALVEALFAPTISTRAVSTAISGRGIGLAAVRTDVERLGGRIDVASVPGQGTTFRVRVPRDGVGVQSGEARRGIGPVSSVAAA